MALATFAVVNKGLEGPEMEVRIKYQQWESLYTTSDTCLYRYLCSSVNALITGYETTGDGSFFINDKGWEFLSYQDWLA